MKRLALGLMIGLLGACGAKSDDASKNAPTDEAPAKEAPVVMRTVQLDIEGMT